MGHGIFLGVPLLVFKNVFGWLVTEHIQCLQRPAACWCILCKHFCGSMSLSNRKSQHFWLVVSTNPSEKYERVRHLGFHEIPNGKSENYIKFHGSNSQPIRLHKSRGKDGGQWFKEPGLSSIPSTASNKMAAWILNPHSELVNVYSLRTGKSAFFMGKSPCYEWVNHHAIYG